LAQAASPPSYPLASRGRRARLADPLFKAVIVAAALLVLVSLGLIVVLTTRDAWPFLSANFVDFVTGRRWAPSKDIFGALPFVVGTLLSSCIALVLAVPVGVSIAVFLNEVAPGRLKKPLVYVVELLAAVPSVVYGLFGLFVMVPFLREHVWPSVIAVTGVVPFLGGPVGTGRSIMAAGLVLALMVVPIVTAISRETISLVPSGQREAAYGLGATRWETIRYAVLPFAKTGIIGAFVLGLGRAMGETIAVLLVIGSAPTLPDSIFHTGNSMAGVIAQQFAESSGTKTQALISIGVLLFLVTIVVNICAQWLVRRAERAHA
jgi:phosphate transport system permease protein